MSIKEGTAENPAAQSPKDVRITLAASVLSSLEKNLDGINRNPILAIREIFAFSKSINVLSDPDLLRFDPEEHGIENMPEKCKTVKEFIIDSVIEAIRIVKFKIANSQTLNDKEQSILMDLETTKTPEGEECTSKNIKKVLKNYFSINNNTTDADMPREENAKKIGINGPGFEKDVLMLNRDRHFPIWRIAEIYRLPYKTISDIVENKMLSEKNQVVSISNNGKLF